MSNFVFRCSCHPTVVEIFQSEPKWRTNINCHRHLAQNSTEIHPTYILKNFPSVLLFILPLILVSVILFLSVTITLHLPAVAQALATLFWVCYSCQSLTHWLSVPPPSRAASYFRILKAFHIIVSLTCVSFIFEK